MKKWQDFDDECTRCGTSPIEILTDAESGYAYDGDDAKCPECGLTGAVNVYDEDIDDGGLARIDWSDYED